MAKILKEVGHLKIKEQTLYHNRTKVGPIGLRRQWDEYQVWEGRKIVSRHELLLSAIKDAEDRLQKHWDEIAKTLKAEGVVTCG